MQVYRKFCPISYIPAITVFFLLRILFEVTASIQNSLKNTVCVTSAVVVQENWNASDIYIIDFVLKERRNLFKK